MILGREAQPLVQRLRAVERAKRVLDERELRSRFREDVAVAMKSGRRHWRRAYTERADKQS